MMVTIKRVSINELNKLVLLSYSGDSEGLEKYHLQPFTLEDAAMCTVNMIRNESKGANFIYYRISYQQRPIGYFVVGSEVLYSFCINIKYRRPKIIMEWWNQVIKMFKGGFYTAVYDNNTRALNFLKRRGMKVVSVENNVVKLIKL